MEVVGVGVGVSKQRRLQEAMNADGRVERSKCIDIGGEKLQVETINTYFC